jgi:hypothetical protein
MTLRHGSALLLTGAVVAGIGVACSGGDSALNSKVANVLLVLGGLLFLVGCGAFCVLASKKQVLWTGLGSSMVLFVVIPAAASLYHFDPNVQGVMRALWLIWLFLCLVSPGVLTAAVARGMTRRRPAATPER